MTGFDHGARHGKRHAAWIVVCVDGLYAEILVPGLPETAVLRLRHQPGKEPVPAGSWLLPRHEDDRLRGQPGRIYYPPNQPGHISAVPFKRFSGRCFAVIISDFRCVRAE